MAAIYPEMTLEWEGETYKLRADYRMIQRIESNDVSIAGVASRIMRNEPPFSHIAFILAYLLRAAGARGVNPDAVYEYILTEASQTELANYGEVICMGFTPQKKRGSQTSQKARKKKASGTRTKRKT